MLLNEDPSPAVSVSRLPVFAAAQFVMSLSWVAYAIFLPALAQQAGLAKTAVVWLLLVDQMVFMVADVLAGIFSDRMDGVLQKWGRVLGLLTGASALALLAIPLLVDVTGAVPALVVPALIWVACSAALRAPLFALVGKRAGSNTGEAFRWLLLGNGFALACAPYLATVLKGSAPLVSFAIISAGLVLCAVLVMRSVADASPASVPTPDGDASCPSGMTLLAAVLCAALAIQVHNALNAGPLYVRGGVAATELHWWMPAFWAGFNLALIVPAPWRTWPAARRIALFAAFAGLALFACAALTLPVAQGLSQALAGVAWAWLLCTVFSTASTLGRPARQGLMVGSVHAALAGAAALRLALVAGGATQAFGSTLFIVPVALAVAAASVLWLASTRVLRSESI